MNAIYKRRSIRKFCDKKIERDLIVKIIEAATKAPSAKNRQPWKFIVFQNKSKDDFCDVMYKGLEREKSGNMLVKEFEYGLADAFNTLNVMRNADVIITVLNTNGKSPYESVDTEHRIVEICDTLSIGAAVENMILSATENGLGSLWIANTCFSYPELCEFLKTDFQLTGVVALGYSDENPSERPRKKIEDVIVFND